MGGGGGGGGGLEVQEDTTATPRITSINFTYVSCDTQKFFSLFLSVKIISRLVMKRDINSKYNFKNDPSCFA